MDPSRVSDLYEIQKLKARYFRLMDTKQWAEFRDVFTDDLQFYIEGTGSEGPTFPSAEALVSYLARAHPDKVTVHQGHMPEIEFTDENTATGIWAMYDWVDDPGRGGAWQGLGHYHERYVRGPDGRWRIASVRLTRLRVDPVPPQRSMGQVGLDPEQLQSSRNSQPGAVP